MITLFLFLSSLFIINTAFALSCSPSYPVIGEVVDFSSENGSSYSTVLLENVKLFNIYDNDDLPHDISSSDFYPIDAYEDVVHSYINGEKLPEYDQSEVSYSPDLSEYKNVAIQDVVLEKIDMKAGDILISGPPFHVCSYSFIGIFSQDGKLKYVVVSRGSYDSYSYRETEIEVAPGREIKCDNDSCKVQVDYRVGDEKFTLSLNQFYSPEAEVFSSFTLLDSSDYKKREDDFVLVDSGMSRYVTYIIAFSKSAGDDKCESVEECDETEEENSEGIFRAIVNWFKSLFS